MSAKKTGGGGQKGRPPMYLCGTAKEACTGVAVKLNANATGTHKGHMTPQEAFTCHRKWLLSQGFTALSARDLAAPNDGPVRVLTKPSRFGTKARNGKEGSRNMLDGRSRIVRM